MLKVLQCLFGLKQQKLELIFVELDDNDNSLDNISKSYTINTTDTWEKKTVTFAGDTTGTLDNDNSSSFNFAVLVSCWN
jgi:hypothetical protein